MTWGEASRYAALDAALVAQELTERSTLLAQLDDLSLHDDELQQGAFKKAGTLGERSYAQAAARRRGATAVPGGHRGAGPDTPVPALVREPIQ